jgi:hypothetical protein
MDKNARFTKGVYFVSLLHEKGRVVKKLMVE